MVEKEENSEKKKEKKKKKNRVAGSEVPWSTAFPCGRVY
jgi:hypothetical protein